LPEYGQRAQITGIGIQERGKIKHPGKVAMTLSREGVAGREKITAGAES